jgi:hypothetical protein
MPIGNWNLQWLNHNSQRSYPLTERTSKVDTTDTIRIPDSFIVGLYLPIHAGLSVQTDQFFVNTLLISPTGYAVGIGYFDPTTQQSTLVASATVAKATHAANNTYALGGINDFADTIGQIVIGRLDEIDTLPPGLYTFSRNAAELETDTIRPMIRGVSAIRVINNQEISPDLYGDIELVAGTNFRIDYAVNPASGRPRITLNAISGLNLNAACDCDVNDTGECIRCINGVCSDDGNFTIAGNECVTVGASGNGLQLADVCAVPCCGCAELDAIKTQIDRFSDGVSTMQNFVTRLSSEVTQMSLVVLGSRLGDAGCNTCG